MRIIKKGLAILLATVMLFTVIPFTAFAETSATYQLVVDQITTITLDGENSALLSFTPEVSGYYEFYSANRGELDPQAWLYDSEGNQLSQNDDCDESWEFSLTYSLVAGQEYLLEVKARDLAGNLDVGVCEREPKVIESIDFEDIYVFETDSHIEEVWIGEERVEYSKYSYDLSYTVTYSDGSYEKRSEEYVYDDISSYYISITDDQSYETPWDKGAHTATAEIEELGITATFTVNVAESPVASVVVGDTKYIEYYSGRFTTDIIWDEETEEQVSTPEYFFYEVNYPAEDNTFITLKDGTVINGTHFQWNGHEYRLQNMGYIQNYENQWTVGNTYDVSYKIAGFEFTRGIEICETPVDSVDIRKMVVMEGTNGHYRTDTLYDEETGECIGESPEYFYYSAGFYAPIITLKDGTVIENQGFEWYGRWYNVNIFSDNQSYENQWTVGNTYEVNGTIAGFDFSYEVEIMASPVASVKVEKYTIMEGTYGYYTTESLRDEHGNYLGESPKYYYYHTPWPQYEGTVITLKDGTVINGNEFEYDGEYFSINIYSSGQNYENRWTAGNTYEITGEIAGYEFTYEVEIIESPVASVKVDKVTVMEGSNGEYTTESLWDEHGNYIGESPEYFRYHTPWPQYESTVITLKDGTVIEGSSFELNGEHYYMTVYGSQNYENRWIVGNTYEVNASIAGYEFTYEVEIIESPVASVVAQPVRIAENTNGWYSRDQYWNEEIGDWEYSPEYFCYNTPFPNNITITLKDGTVINDRWFQIGDTHYSVEILNFEQSYENQFTVGVYEIEAEIAGCRFTFDFEISELTVDDTYEYMSFEDGVIITDCFIEPETLEIPSEIGGKAVVGVASLGYCGIKNLVLPDSVEYIGEYMLDDLYNLETITFGAGINNLESTMFWNLYTLTSITVSEDNPNYATVDGVLYNKNKTTVIAFPVASGNTFNVPDSVTNIDALSLSIYDELEIIFSSGNPNFVTEDGVTYNKDKTKILFCSKNKSGKYVMPNTVTEIAQSAFSGCEQLTEVVVSSQVTELVYCVFFSCLSLEKVELPDGLVSIEQSAFENTTALENIELPEGLVNIAESAFLSSGLTSLTVPNSVKVIGYSAFASTNIATLDLGTGVVKILGGAFANTPVTAVTLPNSLAYLGDGAFANCYNLTSLSIGKGLSEINDETFRNTAIKNLGIPENIYYIGEGAFANSQIETLTLNEGLEWIEDNAFSGCENLTSVVIPDSVEYIGLAAFANCKTLANVKLGDGMEFLGSNAFANTSITDLDLGNSIEFISDYAFVGADMTEQFFPNSVTTIMYGAFMDCEKLTSIELPLSVDTIEYDAFANCSNLTDVYYEGTEEDRNNMNIDPEGNEYLLNATWHYEYSSYKWSDIPEGPDAPTFVVESADGRLGDTVTVAVKTKNNPGISGLKLLVGYDSNVLEFVGGTGADFADGLFSISPTTNNPISIVWTSTTVMAEDGTIALLTFRIKDDAAAGNTKITLSYDTDEVFGADTDDKVAFAVENGFVNVISYVSGDVNDDNVINNKDLALLLRFVSDWEVEINELAADVNRDGEVNTVDLGILLRYLSDWDVELK